MTDRKKNHLEQPQAAQPAAAEYAKEGSEAPAESGTAKEIGGRKGPDPTRYGDWEKDGRCIDF